MNDLLGSVAAVLFGGVCGLIFVSPVFFMKWYRDKKDKTKRQLVETQLQQQYPTQTMIFVRYSSAKKLHNQLKRSNFSGTGFLLLSKKEMVYHDVDANKPPISFPIKDLTVEWVGYHLGSGWVPWFSLTAKGSEALYFTGGSVNWAKNMAIFKTVATAAGQDIELKTAEKLDIMTSNKNASWFNTIGYLTLLNTALIYFKTDISFMYGLTMVQFSDVILIVNGINTMLGLAISVLVSVGFMKLGNIARQGKTIAYKIGLIVLVLDSLLLLGLIFSSHMSMVYLLINVFFRTLAISAMVRGAFVQQAPTAK